jgi:hypothetical protein
MTRSGTPRWPSQPLVVALCVLALQASGAAAAGETIRHVVQRGDTCASIAQRYYGDSRFADLLHAANPELTKTPPPHVLREGTVLLIPEKPAPAAGPDAEHTTETNLVDVLTPETKRGKPNDPLFRGNRVSTQAASAADVTFRDETQVKLGERTLVIILGDAKSAAQKLDATAATTLVTGNLRAFMASSRKAPAAIATDAAQVKVYDGEAQVSADAVKTTRLAVYGGSSTIDARGATREVARGFGSKAELGKPPTPPRALPLAPVWQSPPPLVLLDDGSALIVGEYDLPPADDARIGRGVGETSFSRIAEWRVQIARDGIFRDVAVDTRVPRAITRLSAQPPGADRYYIRVSAIDEDHFEGPFGRIARVLVIKPTITDLPHSRRRIELQPPDAFCVRVGNVPLSRIDGPILAATHEPVRLRCAPSESDPTTLFSLD